MRSSILLLASASAAHANWLRWSGNAAPVWTPQETGYLAEEDQAAGWTPKPTQAPGVKSEGERVIEILRRDTTTWINSETCGWISGVSSYPWTCSDSSTCATNVNNIVACASGTSSPFFSVCYDFAAYQEGKCESIGSLTGCCQSTKYPACGTYLWTGSPVRSMFRCFSSATIISMLDVPQFVLDASTASTSTRTTTSDSSTTTTSDGGGSGGSGGSSGSNTGAIVGGVVGGVGGIAIIVGLVAWVVLRNKRKNNASQSAYNAVPPNDTQQQPPQNGAQMPQTPGLGGQPNMAFMGAAGATTYPPQSPFVTNNTTPSPNPQDPRNSMMKPYDPSQPSPQQFYDPAYAAQTYPQQPQPPQPSPQLYQPYNPSGQPSPNNIPGSMGGSAYAPDYQHPQMTGSSMHSGGVPPQPYQNMGASELDGNWRAGQPENPVEMPSSPQQRY